MSEADVIAEIVRLYNENAFLKHELADYRGQNSSGPPKPQLAFMEKYALEKGRHSIANDYVNSWRFNSYGPKVYDSAGEVSEVNIYSFEEWFAKIKPAMFDEEEMFAIFQADGVSFKEE